MFRYLPGLVIVAVLSACVGTAGENVVAGNEPPAATASSDQPKKLCYRERTTGFRLGAARVCKSVSE